MLRRFTPFVALSSLALLAACSSSSSAGGVAPTEAGAGGASGTGGAGAGAAAGAGAGAGAAAGTGAGAAAGSGAGAAAGSGAGAAAGSGAGASAGAVGTGGAGAGAGGSAPMLTSFPASFVPVMVPPGQEATECITFPLSNPSPVLVRRFSTQLEQGTHHIILYRAPNETASLTPTPCQGFSGLLQGSHPIFIAQQAHSELQMPTSAEGLPVALQLDANEMVRMEMHFINTTSAPMPVSGTITMDTLDAASTPDGTWVKSDLAFWGTANIDIQPHSKGDSGVHFQAALPDTHVFALTTHEHHLGTSMKVWYGAGASDLSMMVANGTNWSDPPLHVFAPPLDFPAGQNLGFAYQCQWQNDTDIAVHFGESVNDEMCFLWHYYYPAKGFQLCIPEAGGCQIKSK